MKLRPPDTIAAIATPLAESAISIVRVSGPTAISLVGRAFRGSYRLDETPGYMIRHGKIVDQTDETIDEVLVSVFRSPHSYTGEDSVEISCHGGVFVTKKVLAVVLKAGARQADPGEFTKRAFLNGKIDLAQAEAVAELIKASSDRALRNSTATLGGALGERIHSLKNDLIEISSLLELQLDFSEEDIPSASRAVVRKKMTGCQDKLASIRSSFKVGKMLRDGASVAIVGRPNVGKSTLFNRLLMENRSIVSRIPGTTRDFLEESIAIDGVMIRLIDTAGLRTSGDELEIEGISRTRQVIGSADVVLLVLDATEDREFEEEHTLLSGGGGEGSRLLIAENKADIAGFSRRRRHESVRVSGLTGDGLDELKSRIMKATVDEIPMQDSDIFICSARQQESLDKCLQSVNEGVKSLDLGVSSEFVASDIRASITSLAEITGEITTEEILNGIFSRFCIGK